MAIIKCPECNKEVSDKAEVCLNCGFGISKYIKRQQRIVEIQKEAEREAYWYVKRKMKEAIEKEEARKNEIYSRALDLYISESSLKIKEAEKLFESILGWKDSEKYYNNCEKRIIEVEKNEREKILQKKKKNKKAATVSVVLGTLLVFVVLISIYVIHPLMNYNNAIACYEKGEFEIAKEVFEELSDYKDSKKYLEKCEEMITEETYKLGQEYVKNKKYNEAHQVFAKLQDYKETALWEEYIKALRYAESGKLNMAYTCFMEVHKNAGIDTMEQMNLEEYVEICEMYKAYCGVWEEIKRVDNLKNMEESDFKETLNIYVQIDGEKVVMDIKDSMKSIYSGEFDSVIELDSVFINGSRTLNIKDGELMEKTIGYSEAGVKIWDKTGLYELKEVY